MNHVLIRCILKQRKFLNGSEEKTMQIHRARGQNVYLLAFLLFAFSALAQTKRLHPDIQNIGKRNLTPNVWGMFPILPEHEKALGAELSKEFETTVTLLDDTLVAAYVNRLGARLVQYSDARSAIEFKIVDSEQADFTVLPAGHVFVNTRLIVAASNEAELAAALSNAIAHVAAHHSMQMLVKAQVLQIPAIPALATAWHWSKREPQGRVELEGIKKECDSEADQLAIQYLWNTGYDPAVYVTVLEKLPKPQLNVQERLRSAMIELQSLPDKRPYQVNSVEFDAVKSHLLKR
jgi:predicted Zn-dependent protease